MAKKINRTVALAESWFGVSHNVPQRGTAAHKRMVAAYRKTHPGKARSNPFGPYKSGKFVVEVRKGSKWASATSPVTYGTAQTNAGKLQRKGRTVRVTPVQAIRSNPVKTRSGRTLHPENCPIPLAASILDARRDAGRAGKTKPVRFANCDYRSATYAMRFKPEDSGSKFSGTIKRGLDKTADWHTRSEYKTRTGVMKHVNLSYWRNGIQVEGGGGQGLLASIGRMLTWWPSSR